MGAEENHLAADSSVAGPAAEALSEYRDVGLASDFEPKQNIFFAREPTVGGGGAPRYWDLSWFTKEVTRGAFVEDEQNFWWATAPQNLRGKITARAIKFHHHGRIHIRSAKFRADATLYLSLRFRDDLLRPAPLFLWDGSNWVQIGTLGGNRDHRWKTSQWKVSPTQRASVDGYFIFKIGVKAYSDSVSGDLPIDKIKLADNQDTSEFQNDADGLWPAFPAGNFDNLASTREFIPGEGPFFPYGVYGGQWVTDRGGPKTCGSGPKDSWRIMAEAGMNTYVIHGWQASWASAWVTSPGDYDWDDPGVSVNGPHTLGLEEQIFQAKCHGLKIIPNFVTDTRAYWIKHQYGDEQKTLEALGNIMTRYKSEPAILAWYPVDEWDHEAQDYGKPQTFSHLLYHRAAISSPNRPRMLLSMGFFGADTWKLTGEEAEILATDIYLNDHGGVEPGLARQAEVYDTIRRNMPPGRVFIAVPESYNGTPQSVPGDQIVAQFYNAVIHGAAGVIFFGMIHPNNPKAQPTTWDGFRQIGRELFGTEGIAPFLLPPARTLDIMGESGLAKSSNPNVHFIYLENGDSRMLIAVNSKNSVQTTTFAVEGLKAGTAIGVRFERGRTVTAGPGEFSDSFGPLERHVYDLK